jgi:hypothetical protein
MMPDRHTMLSLLRNIDVRKSRVVRRYGGIRSCSRDKRNGIRGQSCVNAKGRDKRRCSLAWGSIEGAPSLASEHVFDWAAEAAAMSTNANMSDEDVCAACGNQSAAGLD